MVNPTGGSCYVSPCSLTERGGVEGTGTVAETASQRRADAPWAVDLVQRPGHAGPGNFGYAASARGVRSPADPPIQRRGIDGVAHAGPSGASFEVDAGRRIRGGGNCHDASSRVRPAVQPVVVAQADRLPGGTADDSRGFACDHRKNSGST